MRGRAAYFVSGFMAISPMPALAQSTLLPEIEVTAETAGGRPGQGQIGGGSFEAPDSSSERTITGERLNERPVTRPAEVLEAAPGLIITQHSGEGKANQYFLRGFNLDHGTDLAINVDGMPVNMPTHGHGQGYADLNFLIPELVSTMQVRKGPYFAQEGDFSSAGSVHLNYIDSIDKGLWLTSFGSFGHLRGLVINSAKAGEGQVLFAGEATRYNGPWDKADDLRKINVVTRYSQGTADNGLSITAMAYANRWNSTDQVAERAITSGLIGRFGTLDPTDGGNASRFSLSGRWSRSDKDSATRINAYAINSSLNLWNNFTYYMDNTTDGDQFRQFDRRTVIGGQISHTLKGDLAGKSMENEVGFQSRYDAIRVGLEDTVARQTTGVVRNDFVRQGSAAVYAENRVKWTDWFRTTLGARGDLYAIDVNSNIGANSGKATDGVVSPKFGMVFGPWSKTEFFVNVGRGFHSNDARGVTIALDPKTLTPADKVPLLVRAQGAEIGFRTRMFEDLDTSVTFFGLDYRSELLFVGDAGTTEPSRASRRYGVEFANHYKYASWLSFDVDLTWSHAKFTSPDTTDPALGNHIPGAPTVIAAAGFTIGDDAKGWFGGARLRFFGARPLDEDKTIQSRPTTLVNARLGYAFDNGMKLQLDALNLFNVKAEQIAYAYESRLNGESPAPNYAPTLDKHIHPVEPLAVRLTLSGRF
jgi:outer membrane receptor protein involved in Fe transport